MLKHRTSGESIDRVFHALADPSRRVIVERLSRGSASVSELARPLPMSLPAVVQHIQVLETSGLVRSEKVGRVRTCEIEPAALRPVEQWISARRSNWERRLDRLGDYLAEGDDELVPPLRAPELATEPAELRVVDVAAVPTALRDRVERDEAKAGPRAPGVVARRPA